MKKLQKICALMMALACLFAMPVLAEESEPVGDDQPFMNGTVVDATMNTVLVHASDGKNYAFTLGDTCDKSGLANGLAIGNPVTVTYTGTIDTENADASAATVVALADGAANADYTRVLPGYDWTADLDGNGELDSVVLSTEAWPEMSAERLIVTVNDARYETSILISGEALICKLDPTASKMDILVTGDEMSDDYSTTRLQYDGTTLTVIGQTIDGRAEDVIDGIVTIGNWVNVLGTRWCTMPFTLGSDDTLVPVEGELWTGADATSPQEWDTALTTKIALPVTFTGDGEKAGELPAETVLQIVSTDKTTLANFVLEDGTTGRIDLTPSANGYGSDINGVFEDEYFKSLPYAG